MPQNKFAEKITMALVEYADEHGHTGVRAAVASAKAAGVPFLQIVMVILPYALQMLAGQPINFPALIAAILALFNQPTPTPTPTPTH